MSQQTMKLNMTYDRRSFLKSAGASGAVAASALALVSGARGLAQAPSPGVMSPNEDLMQEHALLNRVLMIYDEGILRLSTRRDINPDILLKAAQIIKRFVEEYHERNEEDYVFPRFEKVGKLIDLVSVLRQQHKVGREQTAGIIGLANLGSLIDEVRRNQLTLHLKKFGRRYRPHEAREGSVLYPAFRDLLPTQEFFDLGDLFEKKEHEVLGSEGFEGQVEVVAGLEKQLGIYDLSQFTPI